MLSPLATRRRVVAATVAALTGGAALLAFAACSSDDSTTTTPAGPPTTFVTTLSAANERPVVNAPGTGTATVTFTSSVPGGPLTGGTYTVTVQGLTGAPTASHIHAPADVNTSTGVLLNFNPASVTTTSGTFSAGFSQADMRNQAVSIDSLVKLVRAGLAYVNVHTSTNPGGEIRGQLVPKP
ncbi:CHRD domain containing protein (plasmid) [Gemmatirosa kalamazoonensis]|uniref:CHRD domain containing protein n=1 Tax=Gemmatirosa kalamazoonensis TaxID=861299 RepID=W0RW96_9BACT|nr:CHRD domain-containing protein [Gemmatirosa kalamazoonensis]AHG93848.1 CHRD domain containing protein [Gemmatirosa kalamazoonensis]